MTPSTLTSLKATINIDKANLSQLLNARAGQILNTLPPQKIDMGEVLVRKKGNLTIEVIGRTIHLEIPLSIYFKGKKLLGLVEAKTAIALYFKTEVGFEPYWQLRTNTKLERYDWLEKPDIQFSVLNFSIESIADQFLSKYKEKIEKTIDNQIAIEWQKAEVAKIAEAFFSKAHQLRPGLPVFLKLSPERIYLLPADNTDQRFEFFFDSTLQIDLTSKISPFRNSPLPTPSLNSLSRDNISSFHIQVDLDYPSIENILEQQISEQSFSYRNNTVQISSLTISKVQGGLRFNIALSGYLDGTITMDCLPIYDAAKNQIYTTVDYFDLKADSFWKQSIVNIFSSRIKKELAERLQVSLDDLLKLEEIVNLKNFSPQEGIHVKLDIQQISLQNLIVGEKALQSILEVTAFLDVELLGFRPSE